MPIKERARDFWTQGWTHLQSYKYNWKTCSDDVEAKTACCCCPSLCRFYKIIKLMYIFSFTQFFLPCNLNSLYQFYFGFLLYHSVNIFNFVAKLTTKMKFATCIKTLKLHQLLVFPSNGCLIMRYFMPIKIFTGEKGVMWSSSWFISTTAHQKRYACVYLTCLTPISLNTSVVKL